MRSLNKISFRDRLNLLRRVDVVKPLIEEREYDILAAKIRSGVIPESDIQYISTLGSELNIEFEAL